MKLFSPQLAGPYANLVTSPNGYFYRARLPVRSFSLSLSVLYSLPLIRLLLGDLINYVLYDDYRVSLFLPPREACTSRVERLFKIFRVETSADCWSAARQRESEMWQLFRIV